MEGLLNKRVLVGVCGGIAAYKSADLVRRLREIEAEVRVVMTRAACEFVRPLTFQALSGHPVLSELFDPTAEAAMDHIALARWSEVILVAPASANFMARLAHGFADDLLTTLCLATQAPLVVAPAMNQQMWLAPATQRNCKIIDRRGVLVLGPAAGDQACGEIGPGRMLEPEQLVRGVTTLFEGGALAGLHVLITAGPTREAIDPVRYISNRSSGKMGYALAQAALSAAAEVTLVSGPVCLPAPRGVRLICAESAQAMYEAVMPLAARVDIFIAAAAVADHRLDRAASQKLKKSEKPLSLQLSSTVDIVSEVAQLAKRPFVVGFAAETEDLEANACAKLKSKRLDMMAANRVGPGQGFEAEENELYVVWEGGSRFLPRMLKRDLARELMQLIRARYRETHPTESP
ncbi:MAG: bifunctional phosphopantothenoylcysteine decarboxylase/phosphopantothenate--cysteine ligase CoaBC [Gammaproteobacteria bacterium]